MLLLLLSSSRRRTHLPHPWKSAQTITNLKLQHNIFKIAFGTTKGADLLAEACGFDADKRPCFRDGHSYNYGDQGFLNWFFGQEWASNPDRHIPVKYNVLTKYRGTDFWPSEDEDIMVSVNSIGKLSHSFSCFVLLLLHKNSGSHRTQPLNS